MTLQELKQIRLYRQHLTNPADKQTVVKHLNGLQAQFMVNAFHALKIRCNEPVTEENFGDGLVKNWTVRGTVHIFSEDDLPLFRHGRENYRSSDWPGIFSRYHNRQMVTPERHAFWAEFIVNRITEGICERESLKSLCLQNGMTEDELDCIFDPWGGCIRTLCERGFITYKVQEKKAFQPAPLFDPMESADAEREVVSRYFRNYGPATLRDAAYYFGWPQAKLRPIMETLPLETAAVDDIIYFYLGSLPTDCPDIPKCLFLAGFDQLMLGYRKEDSNFLPQEHLRGIFNLAGIVMPGILLNGRIVGKWQNKAGKLTLTQFESLTEQDRIHICSLAENLFCGMRKIIWV